MQKSKIATICLIIVIAVYSIIRVAFLQKLGNITPYVINPLFWITFAIALYKLLDKNYENKKLKKQIIEYTLIACLIYILTYMLSGLFVTFGRNPFNRTIKGILLNIWSFGGVIVAREYIRYRLINNVQNKDKLQISIIVTALFTLIDFEIWKRLGSRSLSAYYIFSLIFRYFIPALSENVLYSYLAYNNNYTSSAIYAFITNLYFWIAPILPNTPWIMDAFVNAVIPLILLLYIRYSINKLDRFRSREKILNSDPRSIIPMVALIIFAVWFAIGVFPIKPISIASGSMAPTLNVGDIAIIKKCNSNDINVGDIIQFQMEGFTVIHRVVEKHQTKGDFYFRTKGDSNSQPDTEMVEESQLHGKVIYKIRYLGYPAIWLHLIQEQEQMEVES